MQEIFRLFANYYHTDEAFEQKIIASGTPFLIGRFSRSLIFLMETLPIHQPSKPYPEAPMILFMRFAKVFEQTHTRFLDLQKAEAQARELKLNWHWKSSC